MEKRILITQEMIDRYGEINGDRDIIHYDHEYALERGFQGTLAHGLMIQGFANDVACRMYGAEWFSRGLIDVKFVGPTYPGDDVVVHLDEDGKLVVKASERTALVGTATLRPETVGDTGGE